MLVENGHYAEIVSNMTITPIINKFLEWDKDLLNRVEFKCSFHYLELKKNNLLTVYAENVKKVWKAGASICVEVTPSDELIPFIDEMKEFSIRHFGALPHISVARDESTRDIVNLTALSDDEYERTWSQFNSDFWDFKKRIFGLKQNGFCYAGAWSYFINLANGDIKDCYYGRKIGNIYDDLNSPLPTVPIAKCPIAHCFNGHALQTLGIIPEGIPDEKYGSIRNRITDVGTEWMNEDLRLFFASRLSESNPEYDSFEIGKYRLLSDFYRGRRPAMKSQV